ncbi:MAG: 3-hydroxyacyl-ACP dehydratase FabZ [Micavibrio sp.]|nr:3-hydroxyacyl-ACP dehydratase FabZ [Micavibrio sp.]
MSKQEETQGYVLDIGKIMSMIPHRYPILLVDRVLELNPGESAVSLKNVTMNEPHFNGHFPDHPVMPGVLIVEAMAQTAALVVVEALGEEAEGKVVYFMTIDNARFRRPVVPGDALHIHVEKVHARGKVWKFKGKVTVDGKVCSEASFSAMIADH